MNLLNHCHSNNSSHFSSWYRRKSCETGHQTPGFLVHLDECLTPPSCPLTRRFPGTITPLFMWLYNSFPGVKTANDLEAIYFPLNGLDGSASLERDREHPKWSRCAFCYLMFEGTYHCFCSVPLVPKGGFPGGSVGRTCLQHRNRGFDPWIRKISWRRAWQPTSVFLSGGSFGQRSLEGYGP